MHQPHPHPLPLPLPSTLPDRLGTIVILIAFTIVLLLVLETLFLLLVIIGLICAAIASSQLQLPAHSALLIAEICSTLTIGMLGAAISACISVSFIVIFVREMWEDLRGVEVGGCNGCVGNGGPDLGKQGGDEGTFDGICNGPAGKFKGSSSLKVDGDSAPTTRCANGVRGTVRSHDAISAESTKGSE